MNRRTLIWWMLAIIAAIALWQLHEAAPAPSIYEMRWKMLEDLKHRFPLPQFPQPWRH